MKEDDWKRMIAAWQVSRKHQLIKNKLKSRRMYILTTKELLEIFDEIMEFDSLSDEDKEAFDWLDVEFKETTSKDDLILSLIQTLIKWHFYMKKYELAQEYEICAKIRDVITIEINECRRMIRSYFFIEEEDEQMYINIRKECKQRVELNYDNWVEYLNNQEEE